MNLQTRKLFVISLIAAVTVLASALTISSWLAEVGAVGWARHVRSEYLTGATVAVIIALLFLLGSQPEIRSIRAPRGGPVPSVRRATRTAGEVLCSVWESGVISVIPAGSRAGRLVRHLTVSSSKYGECGQPSWLHLILDTEHAGLRIPPPTGCANRQDSLECREDYSEIVATFARVVHDMRNMRISDVACVVGFCV